MNNFKDFIPASNIRRVKAFDKFENLPSLCRDIRKLVLREVGKFYKEWPLSSSVMLDAKNVIVVKTNNTRLPISFKNVLFIHLILCGFGDSLRTWIYL